MPLVRIIQAVTANLSGYDREPVVLEPGEEREASENFAEWLRRNPGYGEVLGDGPGTSPSADPPADPPADGVAAEVAALGVKPLIERLEEITDAESIAAIEAIENDKAKPRAGVLTALTARIEAIGSGPEGNP